MADDTKQTATEAPVVGADARWENRPPFGESVFES